MKKEPVGCNIRSKVTIPIYKLKGPCCLKAYKFVYKGQHNGRLTEDKASEVLHLELSFIWC